MFVLIYIWVSFKYTSAYVALVVSKVKVKFSMYLTY
jgi:hypothetical protein